MALRLAVHGVRPLHGARPERFAEADRLGVVIEQLREIVFCRCNGANDIFAERRMAMQSAVAALVPEVTREYRGKSRIGKAHLPVPIVRHWG